jgi:hypothetical protein
MQLATTRKSRFLGHADRILGKTATAVAVATGAGLVGQAQEAQAQIVYSGPVNIAIPLTTAGVYVNVVTGVNNPSPGLVPGWDLNPFSATVLSWFAATPNASSGYVNNFPGGTSATLVDNLAPGTPINGVSGYTWAANNASESTGPTAFNFNSDNNYVGFRFQNEAAANQVQFGWVQVHLGATFIDPARSIIGYAYESSGASILSGATGVPEPTSLALLSVGAVGLTTYRRLRRRGA